MSPWQEEEQVQEEQGSPFPPQLRLLMYVIGGREVGQVGQIKPLFSPFT